MSMSHILCKHRCKYFISHLLVSTTSFYLPICLQFLPSSSIFGFATSKSPWTTVISPMHLVLMASCSLYNLFNERFSAVRNSSCVACSFVMHLCSWFQLFLHALCMLILLVGLSFLLHFLIFSCVISIVCACHDQVTLMPSFSNLIAFMESSDSRLRSLVSTFCYLTDSSQFLHCHG